MINKKSDASEKLGKQIAHIIENLPAGLEVTLNIRRGRAEVSLGFTNDVKVLYADLVNGDALYHELGESLSLMREAKAGGNGLAVEKNHEGMSPSATIEMIEQLLDQSFNQPDLAVVQK